MKKSIFWTAALLQAVYVIPTLISIVQFSKLDLSTSNATTPAILANIAYGVIHLVVFYLFYLILFPKFYYLRRIKKFALYSIIIILAGTGLGFLFVFFETRNITWFTFGRYYPYLMIPINALHILVVGMIACAMRGFISWMEERDYRLQLERKNKETSLALLKAQINPHFLFNTLNNIDVLIEKDPVTASTYLKKLSDILRFTLYESPSETISLQQEVEYIRQYIELQKLRTTNPDFVKFETSGALDQLMVAPMLFIPFIENAFKHSTNKKINNAITISLNAGVDEIKFNCSNVYDKHAINTQEKSGLGLELASSRLRLLYPDNFTLDIDQTAERFTVNLAINLHGH